MGTALNDAAFRLVSHSMASVDADIRAPGDDEERRSALRRQFPDVTTEALDAAIALARRLEDLAIELADAHRGPGDGGHGPELDRGVLAEKCPGFSESSYGWAVNDGYTLTRK